ncbi:hypothetical protein WJX77_007388 [Trebouxia sp. C0004]
MVWKITVCAVLRLLLLSPCAIKANFTEELLVQPLSDGTTLVHFHFQSQLAKNDPIFPKAIRYLIANLPVQELDLTFVRGRWFADRWGPPQLLVTPPGATLRSRFLPHIQDMLEMQYAWGNLTHTLSGLFCSSLNFLADAAMVSMPVHAFGDHNPEVATQWFYGSLPREAVCTENLTPWLKLLPCQGRQGLTQLMDRPTLYGASFHAMRVHLQVHGHPQDRSCAAHTGNNNTCANNMSDPDTQQDAQENASHYSLRAREATLTQTLTLVLRPEQLHTQDKIQTTFGSFGKVVHHNIDLQRLFNVPGVGACSKATHTHIYFNMPKSLLAKADLSQNASDLQAISNSLYSASPAPDTVISSSSIVSLLYNVTASKQAEQPGMPSEQCLQPSLTWHQQPVDWQAQTPPVQVQQSVTGRFGDRGTLVLQLHLHETAKASLLAGNMDQSSQKNATGQESQSLRFCIFQMVPWYFRLLYHTMHFRVDDQDVELDDVLLAHHLQPAEGPGTIALLELCLRLPAATSMALLTIDFQKAFLTVFDHPPDAHRGFDVPAALFTFLDAEAEHQDPWMITHRAHAAPQSDDLADHNIMRHLATYKGRHIYTTGVLVPLPTPDFSMPYNVCCLTCTVLAIYILGVTSLVFGKPEDASVNAKDKYKRFVRLGLLLVCFLGLAICLDKSLQRQLHQLLVELGLMNELV